MKYLFELNHPKHYYQFKAGMQILKNDGHQVHVVARDKDVLLKLLQEENVNYEIFGVHKKNIISKVLATFLILFTYAKIFRKYNSDVIISKASLYGCLIAKLYGKKSIIFPDSEVVLVTNRYVVPLATAIVTPESFELNYGKKHIKIPGFFENCYLAPQVFEPDSVLIEQYKLKSPYAIFRFIGWSANHDVGNNGFSIQQKTEMIEIVKRNMTVYISSEKPLPPELRQFELKTPASIIHHVLYFADLYIGDSQTMATEAALLGTPAIRSNSFVGVNDMSNFKILENKYHLLLNISNYEDVLSKLKEFSVNSQKTEWNEKREAYNKTIGNPNQLIVEIIKNV